ncbi:sporulation delaying protein family toxin [Bacillus alveayuensis]|jgi:SdpC family antimicrobial peptide|uniref:sporulation delaying protein family toxin n=1 Tax=Aeribacillus alveayuensis TaxID=279215 RepID=UPI0006983B82|nr:sporulation delaying protein family toxin [Bacillus alveayuensis]
MNLKKLLSIFMVLTIIFTTTSAFASETKLQNKLQKQYDGETIFRGLVFGQGEVAKYFPEIWSNDLLKKANKKEVKQIANILISGIKKSDPNYFNELKEAVYSGEHLKIQAALNKGGELLSKQLENKNVKNVDKSQVGTATCALYVAYGAAAVSLVAAYSHAVVITAAGGAVAYLYVVTQKKFWTSSTSKEDAILQQEKLVNLVATRFAN